MIRELSISILLMEGVLAGLSGPATTASGKGVHQGTATTQGPLMRVVDINKGESVKVRLSNGETA